MKQSRQKAVLISYLSVGVNAISSLILTNLYVKYLGLETYGIYQMVSAISQYILLFDFGIMTAVVRFRIATLESGKRMDDENLLAHCACIVTVLSLLVVLAGIIIRSQIGHIYSSLTPREVILSKRMMVFIIFQVVGTLFQHYFLGIAMSEERYVFVKGMEFLRISLKLILIFALIVLLRDVMIIFYVDFTLMIVGLTIIVWYVMRTIQPKIRFHGVNIGLLRAIFCLMMALLLQSIATYVNNAADKTILGIMMDKTSVAIYAFAATINVFFTSVPNAMNSVYVPKATQMVMRNVSGEELTDLVIRPGRVQYMFCGAAIVGFALFGRFFIHIWAGKEADLAWISALILMVPHLFPLVQNVCLSILTAMNKRLIRSLIVAGTSAINIVITVILVKKIGLVGAPVGTAVSVFLGNIIASNIYYSNWIGLNVLRMYREIFRRTTCCILFAGVISGITLFLPCKESIHLAIGVLTFVPVYAISLWIYGASDEEKKMVIKLFKR